jgi:trk system potassium uptake protein TrkA
MTIVEGHDLADDETIAEDGRHHAVIVGCGRVGSGLAARFSASGYTVAVIDANPVAFRRLAGLDVDQHVGVGFDRSTMLSAGIERATAVAAVTNGDNTNIVVARTAAEHFKVPRVIARIYDVRRAAIYERLGITTVASAQLTTEMAIRQLLPDDQAMQWIDPSARVCMIEHHVPTHLVGRTVTDAESDHRVRIAGIRRLGAGIVPTSDLVLQEGDLMYVSISRERLEDTAGIFSPIEEGTH